MDKLVSEHSAAISRLENQLKESMALVQETQEKADTDRRVLENQYRERLASLEAEYQLQAENNVRTSEDVTERMQKEIEDLQLHWNQAQEKKILALEQDYQQRLNSIKEEHEKALASAVNRPLALTVKKNKKNKIKREMKKRSNALFSRKKLKRKMTK